ncbi:hypothetical protein EDC19_2048 [Natranaerovirga hydrolytica]|uniref:Uncharacterized protein n=1 Tax=Natranaerovirga hydrolytica TaxID=680378 RepID=A0A4R1MLZ6_9FIRM|nr:hypothetical protein [Natranaerovirga hydrolytica]TCK92892.1 hypothetical protein EDC19_2048 [Natranaerovirga hydrolytica]
MKHNNKRVCKIIDELTTFLLFVGATDININVKNREKEYLIFINSDFERKNEKQIQKLIKGITSPKQEEIEEYYWELTGESDVSGEFNLVGIMIDKAEVKVEGNHISIELMRKK